MSKSTRRQTAEALVDAFNKMDIDSIMSYRSDECLRHIRPSTLGHADTNNKQYRASLERLIQIFDNFNLAIIDLIEDKEANKICMYLTARADTLAGEYINEYMWTLTFNESGTKIVDFYEFVDSVMNRDFWPQLQRAMQAKQSATKN